MSDLQLAKLLFYFNKIEILLRQKGGTGESLSDVIKSFDSDLKSLDKYITFTKEIGHKYYYDSDDDRYYLKDDYSSSLKEEAKYNKYKKNIRQYYENKENILDGFYTTLREIAHERNQILHDFNYELLNYNNLEIRCKEAISYLEYEEIPSYITEYKPYYNKIQMLFAYILIIIFSLFIFCQIENKEYCDIKYFQKTLNTSTYITNTIKDNSQYYYVISNALNIREKPSSKSKKVGIIYKNDYVCITKSHKNWAYIKNKGWVFKKYLSKQKDK